MEKNEILAYAASFDVGECCHRLVADYNQISDFLGWRNARNFFKKVLVDLQKDLEKASADKMIEELKKNSPKNGLDK